MKAKQFFAVGKNDISYLGNDFVKWFGEMPLAEGVAGEFHKLGEDMTDEEIIKKFKPECSLGDVAAQWSKLSRKEWYLFYVRDNSGLLRMVNVHWYSDGWYVYANIRDNSEWDGGNQVFSLNMKICPISSNLPKEYGLKTYKKPDALDRIASALERIARECEKHQLNRASEASRKELTKLKCP